MLDSERILCVLSKRAIDGIARAMRIEISDRDKFEIIKEIIEFIPLAVVLTSFKREFLFDDLMRRRVPQKLKEFDVKTVDALWVKAKGMGFTKFSEELGSWKFSRMFPESNFESSENFKDKLEVFATGLNFAKLLGVIKDRFLLLNIAEELGVSVGKRELMRKIRKRIAKVVQAREKDLVPIEGLKWIEGHLNDERVKLLESVSKKGENSQAKAVSNKLRKTGLSIELGPAERQKSLLMRDHNLGVVFHYLDVVSLLRTSSTCRASYLLFAKMPHLWKSLFCLKFDVLSHEILIKWDAGAKKGAVYQHEDKDAKEAVVWGCGHVSVTRNDLEKCPTCEAGAVINWKRAFAEMSIATNLAACTSHFNTETSALPEPFFLYNCEVSQFEEIVSEVIESKPDLDEAQPISFEPGFNKFYEELSRLHRNEDAEDQLNMLIDLLHDPNFGFERLENAYLYLNDYEQVLFVYGVTNEGSLVGVRAFIMLE